MEIKQDLLSHPDIIKLLNQHLDELALYSLAESIHALDLESLKKPDLSFWSLWDQQLLACRALKQLSSKEGKIKSMRTTSASRKKRCDHKNVATYTRSSYKKKLNVDVFRNWLNASLFTS